MRRHKALTLKWHTVDTVCLEKRAFSRSSDTHVHALSQADVGRRNAKLREALPSVQDTSNQKPQASFLAEVIAMVVHRSSVFS
mmetsp:Transcript_5693/g.11498  ORF Transcript_5693/g.11498 Transcript_5693/m.11498 type:complete len:83 (-) Transcript_5693:253-501(-)